MVGIINIIENKRESQILNLAFTQLGVKIKNISTSHTDFTKLLQFRPDVIIMEMSSTPNRTQFDFIGKIKGHKTLKYTPVLGYGSSNSTAVINGYKKAGIDIYFTRPLKFSALSASIEKFLRKKEKSLNISTSDANRNREGDSKRVLDPKVDIQEKIRLITDHITGLMAFPFTAARVASTAASASSGAKDLAKVIEADPAISANILKVSNTVFFASANRRIDTIRDAVVRIGFKETKRIAMAMSVMKTMSTEVKNLGFNREDFWKHSIASAVITEALTRKMEGVNSETAFLSGLLHDFGILLLDEFFPEVFEKILEHTLDNSTPFHKSEADVINFSFNEVIKELFGNWKMPSLITSSVCQTKEALDKVHIPSAPDKKIALCNAVSDTISKSRLFGKPCDRHITIPGDWVFDTLAQSPGFYDKLLNNVDQEIELYLKFLSIDGSEQETYEGWKDLTIGIYSMGKAPLNPLHLHFTSCKADVVNIHSMEKCKEMDKKLDALIITTPDDIDGFDFSPVFSIKPNPENKAIKDQGLPVYIFGKKDVISEALPEEFRPESCTRTGIMEQSLELRSFTEELYGTTMDRKSGS